MYGRFDTSIYLVPPTQFKPQWTRRCDRRMFTLIHLSTFSSCLWLKKRDYYVHNGRIGLFILSWSTITGYSASILSQLAKNWLFSDSSFFDSWHISADIQWQRITTRWITLQCVNCTFTSSVIFYLHVLKANAILRFHSPLWYFTFFKSILEC